MAVRQEVDLDVSGSIRGLEQLAALVGRLDNSLDGLKGSQSGILAGAEKSAREFNKELAETPARYTKIENSAKGYEAELKRLNAIMDKLEKNQQDFAKGGDYSALQKKIAGVKGEIQTLEGQTKKSTGGIKGMFEGLGGTIAATFGVGVVLAWAQQTAASILNVTAEFQKFDAVLTTSLGSGSAAERAMLMIQDFAAKTPFSVQELTDAYVKLAGRGIRPTVREMQALGDLAASTGKSFDQLAEATLDAMSGENERLKEFGVTAKRAGDVTFYTFKGVTTEVKNTDEAIKDYLISLGQVEGVTGSMANISETLTGRISNLGDSIDNMFLTIGNQETGVMASFISFLSEAVEYTTFLIASTDQLAKKLSAGAISEYAEKTEEQFKKAAEAAKASGEDVSAALAAQSAAMRQKLEADLAAAQRQADIYREKTGGVGSILSYGTNVAQYGIDKAAAATFEASVTELEGKLKALADAERFVLEDAAKKLNQTEAELEAEATKLKGENAKKAEAARLKALADLYKELENLEKQAAQARLNMLDKNSEAYIDAVRKAEIAGIDELRQSIIATQKAAGKGSELTVEQENQINALLLEANKKYYDALYKLQDAERDKLLELQKDSDAKELAQLENKYAEQIRAAEEAGQAQVAAALRVAAEREKAALVRAQAERNLVDEEQLAMATAENSIPENLSKVQAEQLLQEKLMAIRIEFAERELALVAASADIKDRIKTQQLEAEIKRLKGAQAEMMAGAQKFSLQKLLGLDDEQMDAVKFAASETLNQLQGFLDATVALREREVQALTQAIDEKGQELDREIDLNKQGFASNVETRQQEYEELKKQRQKAMKEQQQAQRQQIMLDTVMQVSNMITASSEIFASLSSIPFVGVPLAIGMIATMFGSFVAAKSRALQAAGTPSFAKGGEGRLIKGPSHSQGGIDVVENRTGRKIANIEGGENFYVTNRKSTDKYWDWLEVINQNDEKALARLSLDFLLDGTGVLHPVKELPQRLQTLQVNARTATQATAAKDPYLREISRKLDKLTVIANNTRPLPQHYDIPGFRVERSGNTTKYVRTDAV